MSYPTIYYVEKTTGTFGDALLAYGVASFLWDLLPPGSGLDLRLSDMGSAYVIQIEGADGISEEWIPDGPPPLLNYISTLYVV